MGYHTSNIYKGNDDDNKYKTKNETRDKHYFKNETHKK